MLDQREVGYLACYTLHLAKVNAPTENDATAVPGEEMNLHRGAKVQHWGNENKSKKGES